MGMGWRVALSRELPAAAKIPVDGKTLIHRQHDLDELAGQLGLAPLTDFVSVDPSAVVAYAREHLADFKVPQFIAVRPEPLPRNPNGKVLKAPLREAAFEIPA